MKFFLVYEEIEYAGDSNHNSFLAMTEEEAIAYCASKNNSPSRSRGTSYEYQEIEVRETEEGSDLSRKACETNIENEREKFAKKFPDLDSSLFEVWMEAKKDLVIPEEMEEYNGYVPAENGEAGSYYVEGWNACREEMIEGLPWNV